MSEPARIIPTAMLGIYCQHIIFPRRPSLGRRTLAIAIHFFSTGSFGAQRYSSGFRMSFTGQFHIMCVSLVF